MKSTADPTANLSWRTTSHFPRQSPCSLHPMAASSPSTSPFLVSNTCSVYQTHRPLAHPPRRSSPILQVRRLHICCCTLLTQPASTTESCTPDTAALKRRRSSAEEWTPKEPDNSGDDEEDETREVVKDKSYTFYIGDIEKLQRFMRQRFNELTMKPLRGIVTNWIRLLEPRRLGAYGKYHEMLPSQMPEDATPPWWPKTIIYKEPSHLKKHGMSFVQGVCCIN
jgi:hypothetical protein